jgi:hypothetical protein
MELRARINVRRAGMIAVLTALLVPAVAGTASADAAKRKKRSPAITKVTPTTANVGDTLTIRGRNFLPGKKRNKVTFKQGGSPAVTVKAATATRTRMKVVVPPALAKYLPVAGGAARPSRFRVRVVAGRSAAKGYTALKRSPVIVPAKTPAAALDELGEPEDSCELDTGGVVEGVDGSDGELSSELLDALAGVDLCSPDGEEDDLGDEEQ